MSKIVIVIVAIICFIIGLLVGIVLIPSTMSKSSSNSQQTSSSSSSNVSPAALTEKELERKEMFHDPKRPSVAAVGYMDRVANAETEVKWMYYSAYGSDVQVDIILLAHPQVGKHVPPFCSILRGSDATYENAKRVLKNQPCSKDVRKFGERDVQTFLFNHTTKQNTGTSSSSANSNSTTSNKNKKNATRTQASLEREEEQSPCLVRCVVLVDDADDPDAVRLGYPFLRSLYFVHHPAIRELMMNDYDYVLRTDLDIFFTPKFSKLRPIKGRIYSGRGAYCHHQEVRDRLTSISKKMGLRHRGYHNIGATWLGEARLVIELVELARKATIYILDNEFKEGKGQWPRWWRGVASMYGGEIAVNHIAPFYLGGQLDMPCTNRYSACFGSVIHAWHTQEIYSKFERDKYTEKMVARGMIQDPNWMRKAGNYAMYIDVMSRTRMRPHRSWKNDLCFK